MRRFFNFCMTILMLTCTSVGVYAQTVQEKLAALEAASGGKIGLSALNTANNTRIQYKAEMRFPMQSTFKVMGVAAALKQGMRDLDLLQQKLPYGKEDLVSWSPITEKHLGEGMTISELSAATIMFSDNTAINLLIKKLGGPAAITAFARSIGDPAFRLDYWEPHLNSNPEDIQDTTTPAAAEKSLYALTLGNTLAPKQQAQLLTWMKGNTTGEMRIRAGVPKEWVVADKTGSGDYGVTNDIGLIWPPQGPPIVLAIYYVGNKKDAARREDVIASVTRIILEGFTAPNNAK